MFCEKVSSYSFPQPRYRTLNYNFGPFPRGLDPEKCAESFLRIWCWLPGSPFLKIWNFPLHNLPRPRSLLPPVPFSMSCAWLNKSFVGFVTLVVVGLFFSASHVLRFVVSQAGAGSFPPLMGCSSFVPFFPLFPLLAQFFFACLPQNRPTEQLPVKH